MDNNKIKQYFIASENIHGYSNFAIIKTIQGIVNRVYPCLYLLGDSFAYSNTDREWMDYYRKHKDCDFVELYSVREVIRKFKDFFSGIITFDQRVRGCSEWRSPLPACVPLCMQFKSTADIIDEVAIKIIKLSY